MDHPVLSADELAHFDQQGYVRVSRALPTPLVAKVQTAIWDQLHAQYGMSQQDPTTWRPGGCNINKKIIDRLVGIELMPRLVAAVDQLLGAEQWRPVKTLGGLLLTMPEPKHKVWDRAVDWHFDNDPRAYLGHVDELMLFTFFSSVHPRGGGTLVVAGSPRLVARYLATRAAGQASDTLPHIAGLAAWHPWLADVLGRRSGTACATAALLEEPVEVHGVPLQLVELTGEPGDAVLCHPAVLHAVNINCSTVPRFMRRTNVRRKR